MLRLPVCLPVYLSVRLCLPLFLSTLLLFLSILQAAPNKKTSTMGIFLAAALAGHPIHVLVKLLVRHLRPREEEPARRAVLQAILG